MERRDPPLPPYPNAPQGSPPAQPPVPPVPARQAILNPPQKPSAAALLQGTPQGATFPGRVVSPAPRDGRTNALMVLGDYLTSLVFARVGQTGGAPVFFSIPRANYWVDAPGPEEDMNFPSIGIISGETVTRPRGGIGPAVADASTIDLWGPGTVLVPQGEQEETVELELWSSNSPELHGMAASIEQSLNPTEERQGFLLAMPDYYGQTARFMHEGATWFEDGAVKNRWRAKIRLFMSFDIVRLQSYVLMTPTGQIDAEIPATSDPRVAAPDPTIGGQPSPSGPFSGKSI